MVRSDPGDVVAAQTVIHDDLPVEHEFGNSVAMLAPPVGRDALDVAITERNEARVALARARAVIRALAAKLDHGFVDVNDADDATTWLLQSAYLDAIGSR